MDKMPSDLADLSLLGTADDASDAGSSTYYQTATGHPWALLLPSTWSHPFEYVDILIAYPQLQVWAESGGVTNPTWYNFPDNTFCWKCL